MSIRAVDPLRSFQLYPTNNSEQDKVRCGAIKELWVKASATSDKMRLYQLERAGDAAALAAQQQVVADGKEQLYTRLNVARDSGFSKGIEYCFTQACFNSVFSKFQEMNPSKTLFFDENGSNRIGRFLKKDGKIFFLGTLSGIRAVDDRDVDPKTYEINFSFSISQNQEQNPVYSDVTIDRVYTRNEEGRQIVPFSEFRSTSQLIQEHKNELELASRISFEELSNMISVGSRSSSVALTEAEEFKKSFSQEMREIYTPVSTSLAQDISRGLPDEIFVRKIDNEIGEVISGGSNTFIIKSLFEKLAIFSMDPIYVKLRQACLACFHQDFVGKFVNNFTGFYCGLLGNKRILNATEKQVHLTFTKVFNQIVCSFSITQLKEYDTETNSPTGRTFSIEGKVGFFIAEDNSLQISDQRLESITIKRGEAEEIVEINPCHGSTSVTREILRDTLFPRGNSYIRENIPVSPKKMQVALKVCAIFSIIMPLLLIVVGILAVKTKKSNQKAKNETPVLRLLNQRIPPDIALKIFKKPASDLFADQRYFI